MIAQRLFVYPTYCYNIFNCWFNTFPIYPLRTYLLVFSNRCFNLQFFKNMRSQTALTYTLTSLLTNHFFLKKIYPLYSQYRLDLFISSWSYSLHNVNWAKTRFLSKHTRALPLKRRVKSVPNVSQHPFFLTNSSVNLLKKKLYLPVMLRNSDRLNTTSARSNAKQLKRTELLRKWLSVNPSPNSPTSQVKVALNSLSRHKLLRPLPGPRLSWKVQISDPVKIFETFNSLQKFYNRRYKKYSFTRSLKIVGKFVSSFLSVKRTIHPKLHTPACLPSAQSQFRNMGKLRYSHKSFKKNLFVRIQQKSYYSPSTQKSSPKLPILPLFSTLLNAHVRPQVDKTEPNSYWAAAPRKRPLTPFPSSPTLLTSPGLLLETPQPSSRFRIGLSLNAVLLTSFNSPINYLGTSEKVRLLEQSFSFSTTLTAKKYLSLLVSQTKTLTSRGVWENLFTPSFVGFLQTYKTFSFLGKPSEWPNRSTFSPFNLHSSTRLTHVRFKPGYSRQWRMFRAEFKDTFSLPNRYQYRLTRYITTASINQRKQPCSAQTLILKQGLVEAKLVSDTTTASSFVNSGLVFLNGQLTNNPHLHIVLNDLVQLTVTLKYYSVLKWQLAGTLKNKNLLAKMLWKRGRNWRRNNFTFPKWVLNFSSSFLDTPLYLEVDHFSLSFYVVNNPTASVTSKYPKVLPSYNWKYIV